MDSNIWFDFHCSLLSLHNNKLDWNIDLQRCQTITPSRCIHQKYSIIENQNSRKQQVPISLMYHFNDFFSLSLFCGDDESKIDKSCGREKSSCSNIIIIVYNIQYTCDGFFSSSRSSVLKYLQNSFCRLQSVDDVSSYV